MLFLALLVVSKAAVAALLQNNTLQNDCSQMPELQ
jgi:hypothetical protein